MSKRRVESLEWYKLEIQAPAGFVKQTDIIPFWYDVKGKKKKNALDDTIHSWANQSGPWGECTATKVGLPDEKIGRHLLAVEVVNLKEMLAKKGKINVWRLAELTNRVALLGRSLGKVLEGNHE